MTLNAQQQRERRQRLNDAGICVCGRQPIEKTRSVSRCQACLDHERDRYRQDKSRYYDRVKRYQCRFCGQPVVSETLCAEHLAERREGNKLRYHARRAAGLCTACGAKSRGMALCPSCHKQNCQQNKERRALKARIKAASIARQEAM